MTQPSGGAPGGMPGGMPEECRGCQGCQGCQVLREETHFRRFRECKRHTTAGDETGGDAKVYGYDGDGAVTPPSSSSSTASTSSKRGSATKTVDTVSEGKRKSKSQS